MDNHRHDPSRTPKAMNTWDRAGPAKDKTFPGSYEIDGDTSRVRFARPGEARPTEFSSGQGSGFLNDTYKRQRP
jgi:uncharacterized protein (TIGR03067 family)